jgi:DNA polymerase-3 subunit gamma/tau
VIALARKYRPKRFADLLVQDHVATALRGAVARGRVGHGYLLTGPRGTGKTTAARILAMALNCERRDANAPTGEPCGECPSCERVWSGSANLDVVEIDAASNRGVDDARDLRERAMYAASQEGRHKVYIVDEAHMLTREAWNALLKILEEPPPGVVFVFATTEPQKIASTAAPVLSRLQRFDFRRIGPQPIRERLRQVLALERLAAEDDALALIARYADGGMRDALSVLDQCLSFGEGPISAASVRQVLGLIDDESYAELLRLIAGRDTRAVFPLVDRLVNAGADLAEFMTGAADMLRALLMIETGAEPEGLTELMRQAITRARGSLQAADVVRMLALLAEAEGAIRRSASARLVVETLLLRWTLMDRVVELEQVILETQGRKDARTQGRNDPPETQGREDAQADRRTGGQAEPEGGGQAGSRMLRDSTSAPERRRPLAADSPPSVRPPERPSGVAPLSLEALLSAWPDIVAAARERSILLGQALCAAPPVTAGNGEVRLAATPDDAHLVQGIERQRGVVEELLGSRFAGPIRVLVTQAGAEPPAVSPPKRMTAEGLRAERLDRLRRQDPALDSAADELDLEIVDEGPRSP